MTPKHIDVDFSALFLRRRFYAKVVLLRRVFTFRQKYRK
jgi:hypothetical protein